MGFCASFFQYFDLIFSFSHSAVPLAHTLQDERHNKSRHEWTLFECQTRKLVPVHREKFDRIQRFVRTNENCILPIVQNFVPGTADRTKMGQSHKFFPEIRKVQFFVSPKMGQAVQK